MCRLFLSYSNTDNLLGMFLETQYRQGSHKLDQKCISDHGPNPDGFGFAWYDKGQWIIYKREGIYKDDKQLEKVFGTIPDKTIVLGHVRRKSDGDTEYENTHPFIYKNSIFMHNGKIIDFSKHKEAVVAKITPKYRNQIRGETDSEVLFYLFLSCISKPGSRNTMKKSQKNPYVLKAFANMCRILRTLGVSWIGNIMYADKNYILVTRYSESACPAPTLYTHRYGIASDPLDSSSVLIPENTILVKKIA